MTSRKTPRIDKSGYLRAQDSDQSSLVSGSSDHKACDTMFPSETPKPEVEALRDNAARLSPVKVQNCGESGKKTCKPPRTNFLDKRSSMKSGSGVNKDSKMPSLKSTSLRKSRYNSKLERSRPKRSKQVHSRLSRSPDAEQPQ